MKDLKNTTCDPCEQDFKHKVNELVKEGHTPSAMDHARKSREVNAAFKHPQEGTKPQPDAPKKR